ncbi:hypothetical protein QYH69_17490 [Paraburkholderia sp. SARCC-3016]|uniref:hypothetical protein n=1 Tax=Paraburkholderia sp. SARCC-3016 TaxID=3058611 RepID=UPI0028076FA7|nr:hypothetical protein [Paraburkholderia sp. SARCC-3016]MDQ7979046.1 hypothetical protein [Paraburkholderia sp. SARCC-3016]
MTPAFSGIMVRYCGISKPDAAERIADTHVASNIAPEARLLKKGADNVNDVAVSDQLHVNLWEINGSSILDLGVMINKWESIESIQVDLPWEVHARDVSDLGAKLNNEKTVAAIFNEVVYYQGAADQSYAEISFRSVDDIQGNAQSVRPKDRFCLVRLNPKSFELISLNLSDGSISTQLNISIPFELKDAAFEKIYIRFRVKNVPPGVYSSVFKQKDRNILSSSFVTRIIDFRINVRRGTPDEILANDSSVRFPKFKKIHFFLTLERAQICEFESQHFIGCRSLFDEEVWNEYVRLEAPRHANPANVRNYLGYQWTASSEQLQRDGITVTKPVKDLVVLGRFSHNSSNAFNICRFIFLGLLFGMIGNGLWDIFKPTEESYWSGIVADKSAIFLIAGLCLFAVVLMFTPTDGWKFWNNKRRR